MAPLALLLPEDLPSETLALTAPMDQFGDCTLRGLDSNPEKGKTSFKQKKKKPRKKKIKHFLLYTPDEFSFLASICINAAYLISVHFLHKCLKYLEVIFFQ